MPFLWIPVTLVAAAAQTARNASQRQLIEELGTAGATQVRFLYGFPFALVFLGFLAWATGEAIPATSGVFFAFLAGGSAAQIAATALMLSAMRRRSFSVVTAMIKTEPVQTAIFGLALLGDPLSLPIAFAVAIATSGVVVIAMKPELDVKSPSVGAIAAGLLAGSLFALAAIGFRGAILSLPEGSFLMRATTTLVWSLTFQAASLALWLMVFDRNALVGSLRIWRSSLGVGFLGALASQFWFIGFALTSAANVRTLALVEVPMAQFVSRRLFAQENTWREILGMGLIVTGVALLLVAQM